MASQFLSWVYDRPKDRFVGVIHPRANQRNGAATLRHLVDGHRRHKSELGVRKVVRHSLPHVANRPLRPCPTSLERPSIGNPPLPILHSCIHAEVLVPPLGLREVTRQKANKPVSGNSIGAHTLCCHQVNPGRRTHVLKSMSKSSHVFTMDLIPLSCSLRRTATRLYDPSSLFLFSYTEINFSFPLFINRKLAAASSSSRDIGPTFIFFFLQAL
ncbi:exo-alpha-sialidase [Trypanosoma cruzi]|nr:exo-alpha-sialidase [Trypanosoma cruzi]